jgi:hypothetical protein
VDVDYWWLVGAHFATSAHGQPLPRFPPACPAKATGKCTTGGQPTECGTLACYAGCSHGRRRVQYNSLHDLARQILNHPEFCLQSPVYATPGDNEQALRHSNMGACLTVLICPASFKWFGCPWWDVSRRILKYMADILATYFKCSLSAISQKLFPEECWHVHLPLFWYVQLVPKVWQFPSAALSKLNCDCLFSPQYGVSSGCRRKRQTLDVSIWCEDVE